MEQFKKLNNIIGWSVFLIASFVYLSTIEQTVSFWDCGEYIATAYKLEVGHPPGAPLFQLFGRIFTLFAASATSQVAVAINNVTVGRQISEGDALYIEMDERAILKIREAGVKLSFIEEDIITEMQKIKRKDQPFWAR